MGRPNDKLSAAEVTLLTALVARHDESESPLLRDHELSLPVNALGYVERQHAYDCLVERGLVERRQGVFDRAFSERVHLVRREAARQALAASGVIVPRAPDAPQEPAGPLSRPSALAERVAASA